MTHIDTKICLVCGVKFCKRPTESQRYWITKKYCSCKCSLTVTTVKKQKNSDKPGLGKAGWNKGSKGIMKANSGSFEKGNIPWIKGKKLPEFSGENHPNWKSKIEKECEVCNKKLLLPPWQAKRFRFCGRECWAKGTRGKGSPVYKGENAKTPLRRRIMELPEYKEWHATILRRDDYLCVLCGEKRLLEVDHIKRFLHILQENNMTTIEQARECKELWDLSNGRTLCRPCHRKTDTFGTTGLKKHY